MWDNIVKPTLVLFLVCAVISGSLAYVNSITQDVIDKRAREEQAESRKQVMAEADSFKEIKAEKIPDAVTGVYEGYKGNEKTGYVMDVTVKGYGGDINMTVGVDIKGHITGVKIGSHNETPGLGAKASEPEFISQFGEVTINDKLVIVKQNKKAANEIQAISGATISTKAVTEGVSAALSAADILIKGGE
ncbi:MAG: RnfABCDGE type electron transport complex subunit G [Clostridiaceae bacterium]|nr:RnfABCDGE type electron transport complex subunit G [Clostridiaceae bacterium]